MTICVASAQSVTNDLSNPKYRITVSTTDGKEVSGLLIQLEDSAAIIFPGNRKAWQSKSNEQMMKISYSEIQQVKLKRRNGVLKGALIGFGIGIAPILVASTVIKDGAQGGAFVSIITVPLGLATGSIVGATSQKKFYIGGSQSNFLKFRKRIKNV